MIDHWAGAQKRRGGCAEVGFDVSASLDVDNPFWRFSLAVYGEPGVAEECLAAQAALDIDVNILLFCAWMGAAERVLLDAPQIAAVTRGVEEWHKTVVRPLRAVRQRLKALPAIQHPPVEALRKQVAGDELRAEQIEQAFLFAQADLMSGPHGDLPLEEIVAANVGLCLSLAGGSGDAGCPRLVAAALRPRLGRPAVI